MEDSNEKNDKKPLEKLVTGKREKASRKVRSYGGPLKKVKFNLEEKKLSKTVTPLDVPLEKPAAKRVKQQADFETAACEVNRWEGIVNQRRKADQLQFPVERPDVRVLTQEKEYKPPMRTDLEKSIYGLLHGAKLVKEKEETEEEKAVKKAMTLQEVRERSKELQRARIINHRISQKGAYLKKNKSRKYHRVLKREKLKKMKLKVEQLNENDPEAALAVLDQLEKKRILERMNLRHKNSKWLHLQSLKAPRDENLKSALKENAILRQDLMRKMKLQKKEDVSEEEEEEEGANDSHLEGISQENNGHSSSLMNPWSSSKPRPDTQKGEERSKVNLKKFWDAHECSKVLQKQKDEEVLKKKCTTSPKEQDSSSVEANLKKVPKKKGKKVKNVSNNEKNAESPSIRGDETSRGSPDKKKKSKLLSNPEVQTISDTHNSKVNKKLLKVDGAAERSKNSEKESTKQPKKGKKNKREMEFDFDVINEEENIDECFLKEKLPTQNSKDKRRKSENRASKQSTSKNSAEEIVHSQVNPIKLKVAVPSFVEKDEEDSSDEEEMTPEDFLQEAFQDDFVQEFEKEKEGMEKEKEEDDSRFLPGWGCWAGPGIKKPTKRFQNRKKPKSKIQKKANIIYNKDADLHSNLKKLMVDEIPYPFTSVQDYEASIRAPISRMFVPEVMHKKLVAPKVTTKAGAIIEPLGEEALLKKYEKSHRKKDTNRFQKRVKK